MREIYKYNEQGYYIGADKQDFDELETKKANKEVYPSLYMATDIVPPQYNSELQLLKYDNWTWSIEEIEFQGKYYKKSNADEFHKILKKDLSLYTENEPWTKYNDGTTQVYNESTNKWEYNNKGAELLEAEKKLEEKQKRQKRLRNIKNEIANTVIDYNGWKWKMRKKDIGYITWYEVYADKENVTPITIQDSEYRLIPILYEDFVNLWKLIWEKRQQIISKYE